MMQTYILLEYALIANWIGIKYLSYILNFESNKRSLFIYKFTIVLLLVINDKVIVKNKAL